MNVSRGQALSHPVRVAILDYLEQHADDVSGKQLTEALKNLTQPQTQYHLAVLQAADLIEEVKVVQELGASEHFYAATAGR